MKQSPLHVAQRLLGVAIKAAERRARVRGNLPALVWCGRGHQAPPAAFGPDNRRLTGLQNVCRACASDRYAKRRRLLYRMNDDYADILRERSRAAYARDPEPTRERCRAYKKRLRKSLDTGLPSATLAVNEPHGDQVRTYPRSRPLEVAG